MNKIRIVAGLVIVLVIGFLVYQLGGFNKPVDIADEIRFESSIMHGMISSVDGTYVIYSRGDLIKKTDDQAVFTIDFPVKTNDGITVRVSYYIYGVFETENNDFLIDFFLKDSEQRWIVTTFVPEAMAGTISAEVSKLPYSKFHDDDAASEKAIESTALENVLPVLEQYGFTCYSASVVITP